MSVIGYAWVLANEAVRLLLVWWPVTLVLAVIAIVIMRSDEAPPSAKELTSLPTALLLFPVLIVLWASMARVDPSDSSAGLWRLAVVVLLVMLHLLASAAVVYISRGFRRQTLSLSVLIGWLTGICAYIAMLSVTGRLTLIG